MNHWDAFSRAKIESIFQRGGKIIDIGGGLRLKAEKNNRQSTVPAWLIKCAAGADYQILDKVADYHPDLVGDIHHLPLADDSVDAILCIAVLEHVEEPWRAIEEMRRVLKPGGYCYIYVPFLYYYHPLAGYYGDFYRFTSDGIKYLTRNFSQTEICNVRGALSTVANLLPWFSKRTTFFDWLDKLFSKHKSQQTSGYNIFCIK